MSAESKAGGSLPRLAEEALLRAEDTEKRRQREVSLWQEAVSLLRPLQVEKKVFGIKIKSTPVLRDVFIAEPEREVEVTICTRSRGDWRHPESNLNNARIRISVGDKLYWIPPEEMIIDQRADSLLSNEELDKLEELLGVLKERESQGFPPRPEL